MHNGRKLHAIGAATEMAPCGLCGARRAIEEHDACIANLPGVEYACCGHGVTQAYVAFVTGHVIRGQFDHVQTRKRAKRKERKGTPPCP